MLETTKTKQSLCFDCAGRALDLSQPQVMGILNITPDSYFDGGRYQALGAAIEQAQMMVEQGAAIIDIGGEPTNPSRHPVISEEEELQRVIPVVEALSKELTVPLSVDTSKPAVMQAAIDAGAGLINDVRALRQPGALQAVAKANVPVCLMHMRFPDGIPESFDENERWQHDVLTDITQFLTQRVQACLEAGIDANNLLLDPGIGGGSFGKTAAESARIIQHLSHFKTLGFPLVIGLSRKSFIGDLLAIPVEQRLPASLAATALAVANGAQLIRAHDVQATVEAIRITTAILQEA